ncbi:MAG: hypothetical protein ACREK8_03230 [Gemmatimonadales bacterium]
MTTAETANPLNKKALFHYNQGESTKRVTPAGAIYFPVVVTDARPSLDGPRCDILRFTSRPAAL